MKRFDLSRRAVADLNEIWDFIAEDNLDSADRVLQDLYSAFGLLAENPAIGHSRTDLTKRAVLFGLYART